MEKQHCILGAVCRVGRCWSSLIKPKGSKGSGRPYSSTELTSLAPAKTRQILEGDSGLLQTQPSGSQNHSGWAKCDVLASPKDYDSVLGICPWICKFVTFHLYQKEDQNQFAFGRDGMQLAFGMKGKRIHW